MSVLVCVGVLAPVIAPFDPTEIHARDGLQAPNATYWLGTDNLGRDIFSRIVYAARTSLLVALGSVLVAGVIGVPLGLLTGFLGGALDSVIMRILDAILAFPVVLLAILVVATLGTGSDQPGAHHRVRLRAVLHAPRTGASALPA